MPPEYESDSDSVVELRDALFRLDEKLRLPIVLHYIEGYRTHEIARILGIPKGTVMWRMSKARKELNSMLCTGINPQYKHLESKHADL